MIRILSQCNNSDSNFAKSNWLGGKLIVKLSPCNLALLSLSIASVIKEVLLSMESKYKPIRTWKLLETDKLRSYSLTLLQMLGELFFHLRDKLFLKSALFLPKICVVKLSQTELEMEQLAFKASGLLSFWLYKMRETSLNRCVKLLDTYN